MKLTTGPARSIAPIQMVSPATDRLAGALLQGSRFREPLSTVERWFSGS
jgi:hypothetical protein